MEIQKRVERRFFVSIEEFEMLVDRITMFDNLERRYFDKPVTESIYFTLCDSENSVYDNLYVRTREYKKHLSETIVLDDSLVYLEIKPKKEYAVSFKKRRLISGERAIEILLGLRDRPKEIIPSDCPPLRPFVGTQTKRLHWQTEGLRLTVDPDTYFFGFINNVYRGDRMGNLGEIKVEFKYNSKNLINRELEETILTNLHSYIEPVPNYMERRIRECYAQLIHAWHFK